MGSEIGSMRPKGASSIGGAVGVVVAAALGVLLLRPGSTETQLIDQPSVVPGSGEAVVAELRAPGGLALFGLQLIDPTHRVEVRFTSGPGCSTLLAGGDPWPSPYPACSGPAGLKGLVAGLGRTQSGESILGVEFVVSGDCFRALSLGDPWPGDPPACEEQ